MPSSSRSWPSAPRRRQLGRRRRRRRSSAPPRGRGGRGRPRRRPRGRRLRGRVQRPARPARGASAWSAQARRPGQLPGARARARRRPQARRTAPARPPAGLGPVRVLWQDDGRRRGRPTLRPGAALRGDDGHRDDRRRGAHRGQPRSPAAGASACSRHPRTGGCAFTDLVVRSAPPHRRPPLELHHLALSRAAGPARHVRRTDLAGGAATGERRTWPSDADAGRERLAEAQAAVEAARAPSRPPSRRRRRRNGRAGEAARAAVAAARRRPRRCTTSSPPRSGCVAAGAAGRRGPHRRRRSRDRRTAAGAARAAALGADRLDAHRRRRRAAR